VPGTNDENIISALNEILAEREKFNAFNLVVGNLYTQHFYYICTHYANVNRPQPLALHELF
jgi:hypothetical protein